MISLLRWGRRHIATLLLIASPAIGGQVLPLAHPCPVENPWVADAATADQHAAHGHGGHADPAPSAPGDDHAHADCSCIGACTTPVAIAPPTIEIASRSAQVMPSVTSAWSAVERSDAPTRPHDRLPPQTAPPLA